METAGWFDSLDTGENVTLCNTGFGATESAEGQSGRHRAISPIGDGNSE